MTQVTPDIDEESDPNESNDLRNLRKKAKRADELEKEVADGIAAKRELAFVKAGIDTDSALGALFFKAYDGELDKDTIATAFAALGGAPAETSDSTEIEFSDEERASTRERQNLATGAGDTGETPPQPVRGRDGAAARAGREVRDNGGTAEDALGVGISTLIAAGMQGDRSVVIPNGPAE